MKIISSPPFNLASYQKILLSINCHTYIILFPKHLMTVKRLELSSVIFRRRSTVCGTEVFFLNLNKVEYLLLFFLGSRTTCPNEASVSSFLVPHQILFRYWLAFPQGSILGPLLFLVYINDIVTDIGSSIRLFADDTTLYVIVDNPQQAAASLNSDLQKINHWASTWLVTFNPDKTESLLISRKHHKPPHPPVYMNNTQIQEVESHKHLGITISNDGTWHNHIDDITKKAWSRINALRSLKFILDRQSLLTIYTSYIRPILEYSDVVWSNITQAEEEELEKIQTEASRIITGATRLVSLSNLYKESGLEPLKSRRRQHKLVHLFKMFHNISSPSYLSNLIPESVGNVVNYGLRNSDHIRNVPVNTTYFASSFLPSTISEWNRLPASTRSLDSVSAFKRALNPSKTNVPKFFYDGNRFTSIQHARLRMHCSSLNEHLFSKNIIESPSCVCGEVEDTHHYLLTCPLYHTQRSSLIDVLSPITHINLKIILFGNGTLPDEVNRQIFHHVQTYISKTKRFNNQI